MEKIAVVAAEPAKVNNPSSPAMVTANQTQLTGVPDLELILYRYRENGSAPSRENLFATCQLKKVGIGSRLNANACRDADIVMLEPAIHLDNHRKLRR